MVKWKNGFGRNDGAIRVNNAQDGDVYTFRSGELVADIQPAAEETIFPIEMFNNLFKEAFRNRKFIEGPSSNTEMRLHSFGITYAEGKIS